MTLLILVWPACSVSKPLVCYCLRSKQGYDCCWCSCLPPFWITLPFESNAHIVIYNVTCSPYILKYILVVLSSSICNFLCVCVFSDVPVESLRLRFALLQSLNNTLESFFLPLVELRQTQTYQNSIAALLCEAKGEQGLGTDLSHQGKSTKPTMTVSSVGEAALNATNYFTRGWTTAKLS